MERLTERDEFENADIIGVDSMDLQCNLAFDELNKVTNALNKLAYYEDLEEQGKLKKLPCKIGDTIYVIPSKVNYDLNILNERAENNRVYEQIVNRIEISEYGYLLSTCEGMACVLERFYKKTWFLTQEEAETALKELGEVQNT